MLATTPGELAERRRAVARTPVLKRLRDRLRAQVQPLLDRPIYLPEQKALLSQDGGVCPVDGARLVFDPFSPQRHQCPICDRWYEGERHHRAWITRYQIWLSERAIHLALLGGLYEDPTLTRRSAAILTGYAEQYRAYPNQDNVLGPTRLFFSTYLESIWLCQITLAASLLDLHETSWTAGSRERVRSMVAESAELIASFDEGWSNRQAWNNAAQIGAGRWLGVSDLEEHGLHGPHGLRAELANAVSADGLWFEGENYHFFALRGLLLGAEMLRRGGPDLYADPATRDPLASLFSAPLKTILPDLTLPARGDSPYGVSLFQPRFAELWEIARARVDDSRFERLLANLYGFGYTVVPPEGPDMGLQEMAEQEQNRPPQCLHRERLGWKALLWMVESDPADSPGVYLPGSVLLEDHGVAVLRFGDRYASLECGGVRGGHGHPDLLHVSLFWKVPWLVDPGTASYVSPSLHWYRSTLAHNAPAISGADQASRIGWCRAFAQERDWVWVQAQARHLFGEGTSAVRTLVAGPEWVLDVCDIDVPEDVSVDLPVHALGALTLPPRLDRSTAMDHLPVRMAQFADPLSWFTARQENHELFAAAVPRDGERGYVATAPGPPDLNFAEGPETEFVLHRARGPGRWVHAYAQRPTTVDVVGDDIRVICGDRADVVQLGAGNVTIQPAAGPTVRLEGKKEEPVPRESPEVPRAVLHVPLAEPSANADPAGLGRAVRRLGIENYRRSEEPYNPSDFAAQVAILAQGRELSFAVEVEQRSVILRAVNAPDPRLDNESPDINSDGVQLYVGTDRWQGFVLVPDPDSERVYIRAVAGTVANPGRVTATWKRTDRGYRMDITFDVGRSLRRGDQFLANLVINQMREGRQRRAGQLALAGGGGWIYLRGDRESPAHAIVVEIT